MTQTSQELSARVEEVEWHFLRPHLKRDAIIVVAAGVDLAEAAGRIAADDTGTISAWIAQGKLAKPISEQVESWDAQPEKRLAMLIVQPFVLVQEPEKNKEQE